MILVLLMDRFQFNPPVDLFLTISPQALFEGKEVRTEKEREALRLLTKPPKYVEIEMENMQETCESEDENKWKGD